jgi:hypothetical protein
MATRAAVMMMAVAEAIVSIYWSIVAGNPIAVNQ